VPASKNEGAERIAVRFKGVSSMENAEAAAATIRS
jgi:hypothetical protein